MARILTFGCKVVPAGTCVFGLLGAMGLWGGAPRRDEKPELVIDFESPEWWRVLELDGPPRNTRRVRREGGGRAGWCLRVAVEKGSHMGTSFSYRFRERSGSEPEEAYLAYDLRFDPDWKHATSGGKLPGFAGTYGRAGWGGRPVHGDDGWSARGLYEPLKDRDAVRIGYYVYHADMKGRYGSHWRFDGVLEYGRWYRVELYIRLNAPGKDGGRGKNDGVLLGWIDGRQVFEKRDIRFRDSAKLKIETVWFNVYHGGATPVPEQDIHLDIDHAVIARTAPPGRVRARRTAFDPGSRAGKAAASSSALGPAGGAGGRPNIILFLADDLGYGAVGAYGQTKIRTPHIDRLAREGVRFTAAYAGAAVCLPSRCALMTGRHMGHAACRANGPHYYLYDADITVAECLKRAGYRTGLYGKWGLGNIDTPGRPDRQGFEEWAGQLEQVHAHFHYPYWVWENGRRVYFPENAGGKRGTYISDWLHERALDFIRRRHKEPFFLYVACILPHVELAVPEDSEAPYRGRFPRVPILDPRPGYLGSEDGLATFAGMVSRTDRYVGEILDLLGELGIDGRTLFFFSSDNGPQGGGKDGGWTRMTEFFGARGPFRGMKGSLYEGGIRVPLIARWPGHLPRGVECRYPVAFWDFLPTACALAGVDPPPGIDGTALVPFDPERDPAPGRVLYWETAGGRMRALRKGRWKLLRDRRGRLELYDLEADPGETRNLATARTDVARTLEPLLETSRTPPRVYPRNVPYPRREEFVR